MCYLAVAGARAQSGVAWCRSPPYAPQTASLEGESHAFEAQGASRSIGGPTPVVMPHLGARTVSARCCRRQMPPASTLSLETELNVQRGSM